MMREGLSRGVEIVRFRYNVMARRVRATYHGISA